MDRGPGARGCRGAGHRLRGAAGGICAGVSRSTGLRRPAGLSAAGPASPQQRGRSGSGGADSGLAATSGGSAAAGGCRGSLGASTASSRGHSGLTRAILCLGAGLLGLERRLGMDRRRLGDSATPGRHLGGRPLGKTRPRLCLGPRSLAVASLRVLGGRGSASESRRPP
jgi:hypothetical protein